MSKESRRRQRQSGQVPASGPASKRPASGGPAAAPTRSSGPGGPERAGRRDRARPLAKPSIFQRYRTIILGAAVLAVLALVGAGLFSAATEPAYACTTIWEPAPTPSPRDGASPQPGYVQPDIGRRPRADRDQAHVHLLPAGERAALQAAGRARSPRASTARTTRSSRRAGSTTSSTAALVILYKGAEVDEAAAAGPVRRRPSEPGLRLRAGRPIAGTGDRPLRRHGLAVRRARLGPRAAAPDARPAGHPRLLPDLR